MFELEKESIRKIIHVDMDAFFASVEQRDNPKYRGKPLVVGGSPDSRGVVAAASYEAREFGIRSAMPSKLAYHRCRSLIFAKPRFDVYKEVSNQIREIFFRYTDLVEPLSLDEAFLDVTENKKNMPSATLIAKEIKDTIYRETRLTASCGVSINKFMAKIASDVKKPNGLFLIPPDSVNDYIEELPIEKFFGVGKVTAHKMRKLGIGKGSDLKTWSYEDLTRTFGKSGGYFYNIVRGIDNRPVQPNRIRKSVGAERSYASDLESTEEIHKNLDEIVDILVRRLKASDTIGRTLTLKVKYADYKQVTRSKTSFSTLDDVDEIRKVSFELLKQTEVLTKNVRLLGLAVSNLDKEDLLELPRQLRIPFVQY